MSYQHTTGSIASSHDGFELFMQKWIPSQVRRVFVVQHGFGEHSGRYGNLLDALDGTGAAVYAIDSRGHGKTGGKRGHVDQFQNYVDDLADLIQLARKENMNDEVYLLGHSLGGVIALQYATQGTNQGNLSALILSSPGLVIHMDFGKQIKKGLAATLSRIMPAVTLDANLDLKFLSHDQAVIDAYKADPLVHGKISFQMGSNLFHVGSALFKKSEQLTVPLYLFHGESDQIVSSEGSKRLYDCAGSKDKTLKIYPNLFHETMNETLADKTKVLGDLKAWIDAH